MLSLNLSNKVFRNYDDLVQFINKSLSITIENNLQSKKNETTKMLLSLKQLLLNEQNLGIYVHMNKINLPKMFIEMLNLCIAKDDMELEGSLFSCIITFTDNSELMCDSFIKIGLPKILIDETLRVCSDTFKSKLTKSVTLEDLISQLLLIVHNIARHDRFQQEFLQFESIQSFKSTIRRFFKSKDKRLSILTMAVLTWLVQIDGTDHFIINTFKDTINNFIDFIDKGLKDRHRRFEGLTVWELLLALKSLSQAIVADTSIFLTKRFIDIVTQIWGCESNVREIDISLDIIWHLSLNEKHREILIKDFKIADLLKDMLCHDDKDISEKTLRLMKDLANKSDRESFGNTKGALKYDIFISYCHVEKDFINKLALELKKKYKVWIDDDCLKGDVHDDIARGIEQSKILIMGVSSSYQASPACRSEAAWANRLRKPFIPLLLERKFKPLGWLGFLICTEKYINSSDTQCIKSVVEEVHKQIEHKVCCKMTKQEL